MNKNANIMALILAILFLVTTVTPLHARPPPPPTYYETGTLTNAVDSAVLATFDYRMSGYRNSRIWLRGTIQVYEPTIVIYSVSAKIRILQWFQLWFIGWWDFSWDWDPSPVPSQTFSHPSAGSYYPSVYAYDREPSITRHYKVAVCLHVAYYTIWGVYGEQTTFQEYDWYL